MEHLSDKIVEFDTSNDKGDNKVTILRWMAQHPDQRFDISEVHREIGDDLGVGQGQVRNYLKELDEEDEILASVGERRKAYYISDNIAIPRRYRMKAGLRHLSSITDVERWGISGTFAIMAAFWTFLALPFWLLWGLLFILPQNSIGTITESQFFLMGVAMTVWVGISLITNIILHIVHRWWSG